MAVRVARCRHLLAVCLFLLTAQALGGSGSLLLCNHSVQGTPGQNDQLLQMSQVVRAILDEADAPAVLASRSGIDLDRYGVRYSHAGISLKDSPNTRWSVRQLYYACEDRTARIYDQGLPGFVLDHDPVPALYVSLVFLPPEAASRLARAALDQRLDLGLLEPAYSANAYPFSTRYQNCNQWLIELIAYAFGPPQGDAVSRAAAQDWLRANDYRPSVIDVRHRMMVWLANFVPLLHNDDQPAETLAQARYQLSLPQGVEEFVHRRYPQSRRVEVCVNAAHIVVHRGWQPMADGCAAGPGDDVRPLMR